MEAILTPKLRWQRISVLCHRCKPYSELERRFTTAPVRIARADRINSIVPAFSTFYCFGLRSVFILTPKGSPLRAMPNFMLKQLTGDLSSSPLRKKMLDDMTIQAVCPTVTKNIYINAVTGLVQHYWLSPRHH